MMVESILVSDVVPASLPKLTMTRTIYDDRSEPVGRESVTDDFQWPTMDVWRSFSQEPPSLDFVLPGLLAGTVGGIVAAGGGSKSMFALEMACAVAGHDPGRTDDSTPGTNLLGLEVPKRGKVVYVAAEDPNVVLWQRLHAFGRFWSPEDRTRVLENLVVIPALAKGLDLGRPEWVERLRQIAGGCRLIILDTLTRCHALDENKAEDAKSIMQELERIATEGPAVLFLHHVSKAAVLGGMADLQQAARGSSVFVDNARWLSFLAGMSSDEAKAAGVNEEDRHLYVRWNINKMNYGARAADRWFVRKAGSGVLVPSPMAQVQPKESKSTPRRKAKKRDMQGASYASI